jgi:phage replication initiation protein
MNYTAFYDTLSFSFPLEKTFPATGAALMPHEWKDFLTATLRLITGIQCTVNPQLNRKRNNFDHSATFNGGFFAWGGNNKVYAEAGIYEERPERVQLYLDSEGCRQINENGDMKTVYKWMLQHQGRITRCDPAVDFVNGEVTLDQIRAAYLNGDFTRTARPSASSVQKFDDSGETFYIGKRQNGKCLRAYEKGKQLGNSDSNWVRLECEIHREKRHIALDALLYPGQLWAESYPYLAQLAEEYSVASIADKPTLIKNTKLKTQKVIEHLIRHARRSYGQLIEVIQTSLVGTGWDQASIDRLTIRWLRREVDPCEPLLKQRLPKNLLLELAQSQSLYSAA